MANPVYLVWLASVGLILVAIAYVVFRQIIYDLSQKGVIQEKRIKALKSLLEKDSAITMPEILSFEEFLKQ